MARPPSRRTRARRGEEEAPEEGAGRRREAPAARAGPNPAVLALGAVVVVLIGVAVAVGMKDPEKKTAPKEEVRLGPAPEKPAETKGPREEPPKPLTEAEKKEIEDLFREAEPHMEAFRRHAKEGWALKEKGDNEGANDAWVEAKHEYIAAIELVAQVLEDYERFPQRRQEAFMKRWNDKLAAWQKEWGGIPKVNVR